MKEPEKNICTRKFSAEGRADVHKAKKHLESAKRDFIAIGAYGRAKDVLYLMVSKSVYTDSIPWVSCCYGTNLVGGPTFFEQVFRESP